ncbi:MAG: RrF2 family transcriptional regulator [Verrucomicrobiales bacterium]
MKLAVGSDFAFRLLIYVATYPERLVTVREVAEAYGLSQHHLSKISKLLIKHGLLEAQRGRGGGVRLAKEPEKIRLGDVLNVCEPAPSVIDCKNGVSGPCVILPVCALRGVFGEARLAFYEVMNRYTLHDIAVKKGLRKALAKVFES